RRRALRPGGEARLSRVVESAEHLALSALRLRRRGRDPNRSGAARHADGSTAAPASLAEVACRLPYHAPEQQEDDGADDRHREARRMERRTGLWSLDERADEPADH